MKIETMDHLRDHSGRARLYESLYSKAELSAWARRLKAWKREAFVYLDNTMGGNAPKNAAQLKRLLEVPDERSDAL